MKFLPDTDIREDKLSASRNSAWTLFEDKTDREIAEFTGLPLGVVVIAMENLLGQDIKGRRKKDILNCIICFGFKPYDCGLSLEVDNEHSLDDLFYSYCRENHIEVMDINEDIFMDFISKLHGAVYTFNPYLVNWLDDEIACQIIFLKSNNRIPTRLGNFDTIVDKLSLGLGVGEAIIDTEYWK